MNSAAPGRIVVVGAAGGIGLAILAQLRGRVEIIAVVQNAEQIAPALAAGASRCEICDVADATATAACTATLGAQPLHGLIFCAAVQPLGAIEACSRSELERVFAINVFGTLQFVQGLLPALRSGGGRIVLFSSMAGRVVAPLLGVYSASKHALEALSDALRAELRGSGVTLSLIEPGGVDTPMARAQSTLAARNLERLDASLQARYAPLYRGYASMTAQALRYASRPPDVAAVAVSAVLSRSTPKPRYLIGADARLLVTLKRCLPTRALDALLMWLNLRH